MLATIGYLFLIGAGLVLVLSVIGLALGLIAYPFVWAWEYVGPSVEKHGGAVGLSIFAIYLLYVVLTY